MKELTFDQSRPLDLISMGRVAVDLYAEQIGASLKDVETFKKYVGGSAGNCAIGSARLGLKVSMLSKVGADAMGDFVRETLKEENIDTNSLQSSEDHLTGLVVLGICPPDHFPLIFYRNQCADLYIDAQTISSRYIGSAKALLVTGTGFCEQHSHDTTLAVMQLAKEQNTKIILDIDYRPVLWGLSKKGDGESRFKSSAKVSETLQHILPLCALVVGTEEEICIGGGSTDLKSARQKIQSLTDALIVVKKGKDGCALYASGHEKDIPGYPVPVLNVLGAGDAFMSGLLSVLLKNGSVDEACRRGNACGAIVVRRHGCAPAMPYLDEVHCFQKNYSTHSIADIDEEIEQLHQGFLIKNEGREAPLPIMAFCHRWQFEESCWQAEQPLEKISSFKTAIAKGIIQAQKAHGIKNVTVLTDPVYGAEAIKQAHDAELSVIAPIERSGTELTEWLKNGSAYEILRERPRSWGLKLLWQYHPKQSEETKRHQFQRLSELYDAAKKLDRRLMLEVIAPKDFAFGDGELLSVMEKVYALNIKPYWWKLPAIASAQQWQAMGTLIDEYDPLARVLILGGESKNLSAFKEAFSIAKSSHHGIGFAVGRSIFWPAWLQFLRGQINEKDVATDIAERYLAFYQLWLNA